MMKETTYTPKRLLSLILALVMLLGMLPTAVGAVNAFGADLDLTVGTEPYAARFNSTLSYDGDPVKPGDPVEFDVTWNLMATRNITIPSASGVKIKYNGKELTGFTVDVGNYGTKFPLITEGTTKATCTIGPDGYFSVPIEVTINGTTTSIDHQCGKMTLSHYVVNYVSAYDKDSFPKDYTEFVKVDGDKTYEVKWPEHATSSDGQYTFVGYSSSEGVDILYNDNAETPTIITLDRNRSLTLTAQWEQNCTVTYKGGYTGVSGLPEEPGRSTGKRYTIPALDPKLEGHQFLGWKRSDNDRIVHSGEPLTDVTSDLTLTAQWDGSGTTPVNSYTVSFDVAKAGAYPAPMTQVVNEGEKAVPPTVEPRLEGWKFQAWYLGEQKYEFTETVTENITLTAK